MTFSAGQRVTAAQLNVVSWPVAIGSTILTGSAASVSLSIPSGYNHLQVVVTARGDTAGTGGQFFFLRFNGDSGSNYVYQYLYGVGATTTSANAGGATTGVRVGVSPIASDAASYFGSANIVCGNISSAVFKPVTSNFTSAVSASSGYAGTGGGCWLSTAAVTSVAVFPVSGNFVAGSSMSIYGWG